MSEMEAYRQGFKDGFREAKDLIVPVPGAVSPEAETELPELGEPMPSDEQMLLYATPFFETAGEQAEKAAQDDAAEDEK